MEWGALLVGQLEFYWDEHFGPRLDGLTDAEYLWEPVEGCWSVRPGPDGRPVMDPVSNAAMDSVTDSESPDAKPEPITTIAWRMLHIGIGCFATRVSTFFGDGSVPDDADMFDPRHEPTELPTSAAEAVDFLDRSYGAWHAGIAGLDDDALAQPLGPKGSFFADDSMAALIVHVSREVMHHGGEIGVLRDLYRARYAS